MTGPVGALLNALHASFAAGLGTSVGALALFLARTLAPRTENVMLSAAAGVMLAASFCSLLQPAIALAADQLGHPVTGIGLVIAGLPLALGIGLQNIPEGLAVAVSLVSAGFTRLVAPGWPA